MYCNKLHDLGAASSDDGSKPEILSRITQATAALTKLKPIWKDNISLELKVKLMCSLVISIFLYACESWTLTAKVEKNTQAFEMRCYQRLLNISYKNSTECYVAPALCLHIKNSMKASVRHIFWQNPLGSS